MLGVVKILLSHSRSFKVIRNYADEYVLLDGPNSLLLAHLASNIGMTLNVQLCDGSFQTY